MHPISPSCCPQCGGSQTMRLPVLFQSGIQSATTTGAAYTFGGGVTVGGAQTHIQSSTSRAAAPPIPPRKTSSAVVMGALTFFGSFFVGSFILQAVQKGSDPSPLGGLVLLIAFTASIGLGVYVGLNASKSAEAKHAQAMSAFQDAYRRWELTWQCMQCGVRWIP